MNTLIKFLLNPWFLVPAGLIFEFLVVSLFYRAGWISGTAYASFDSDMEKQLLLNRIRQLESKVDFYGAMSDNLKKRLNTFDQASHPSSPLYSSGMLDAAREQQKTAAWRGLCDSVKFAQQPRKIHETRGDPECPHCAFMDKN